MRLLRKIQRVGQLLQRYRQLPGSYRVEVRRATYWIVAGRAALEWVPFKRVLRYVERRAETALERSAPAMQPGDGSDVARSNAAHPAGGDPGAHTRRVLWAVRAVGRRLLPERPCLTQALVGRVLLAREGVDATLHIGVTKADNELKAHAWLEQDGAVILGGARSREEYHPFPALNA